MSKERLVLDEVPDDTLIRILRFLDARSLSCVDACARVWRDRSNLPWCDILEQQYPHFDTEDARSRYLEISRGCPDVLSWRGEDVPGFRMKSGFSACFGGSELLILFGVVRGVMKSRQSSSNNSMAAVLIQKEVAPEVIPMPIDKAIDEADCVATSRRLLIFGGLCEGARVCDTRVLDIGEKKWTQIIPPSRPPTCHHSLDLVNSRYALLLGGQVYYGEPVFDPWILDLENDSSAISWQPFQARGCTPTSRAHHATTCTSTGFFVLAGGLSAVRHETESNVYILDTRADNIDEWHWTQLGFSTMKQHLLSPSRWSLRSVSSYAQICGGGSHLGNGYDFALWRCQLLVEYTPNDESLLRLYLAGGLGVCALDIDISTSTIKNFRGLAPSFNAEKALDMQFAKLGPILLAFGGSDGREGAWYETPGHWSTQALWFDTLKKDSSHHLSNWLWLPTTHRHRLPRDDGHHFFSSVKAGDLALRLPDGDGLLVVSRASYSPDFAFSSQKEADPRGKLRLDILRASNKQHLPLFFNSGFALSSKSDIPCNFDVGHEYDVAGSTRRLHGDYDEISFTSTPPKTTPDRTPLRP